MEIPNDSNLNKDTKLFCKKNESRKTEPSNFNQFKLAWK